MSRKSPGSHHGWNDVIGVTLLVLVSQITFDRFALSFFSDPHNKPIHNRIGFFGAYLAWFSFLGMGLVAYILPWLLAMFGVGYLLNFLSYLRERLYWSLLWSVVLVVSLTGILYVFDNAHWLGKIHET